MRLKRFTELNENSDESEEESYIKWYQKEGYITHPDVPNKEALLQIISDNVQHAWDEFADKNHPLEEANMKLAIVDGRDNRKYLDVVDSYAFTDNELGIFFKTFKKTQFNFFSGREIAFGEKVNGHFYFRPYIWTTVHLSFEYLSRGTNGASVMVADDSDSIFYHILEKRWYTNKEHYTKMKLVE